MPQGTGCWAVNVGGLVRFASWGKTEPRLTAVLFESLNPFQNHRFAFWKPFFLDSVLSFSGKNMTKKGLYNVI